MTMLEAMQLHCCYRPRQLVLSFSKQVLPCTCTFGAKMCRVTLASRSRQLCYQNRASGKRKTLLMQNIFCFWSSSSSELSLHHYTHLAKIISSRLSVPWDTHQSLYQIYRRISCLMLLDVQQCYIASPYTCSPSTFKLIFTKNKVKMVKIEYAILYLKAF